jgi:4-hydroxybenzoate polyprenyltransferase
MPPDAHSLIAATRGPYFWSRIRSWIKLLRPHQWAKNFLVFLPLMAAHKFEAEALVATLTAFVAFCVAASAIYIINDVADLDEDRKHPTKRKRPLAAGELPIRAALTLAAMLLVLSAILAASLGYLFGMVIAAYILVTTAYTFYLKKKMMIDVVTLASLYTLRVIGGAAAALVMPSEWLLGFSMCIFTSLALVKRYIELATRIDADLPDASNRNYKKSDGAIVMALAAGSGLNAVTILALYISSGNVRQLYGQPAFLWLICPILVYWLGRVLFMSHRRLMHDDPVVFAMKDPNSLLVGFLIGAILLAAKWAPAHMFPL